MYEDYLRDPASVGSEWRELFDNGKLAELPIIQGAGSKEQGAEPAPPPPAPTPSAPRSVLPAHGADGHVVPGHQRHDPRRAAQGAQRSARREREEDLVHAPDRLRDRPGRQALPGHDPR